MEQYIDRNATEYSGICMLYYVCGISAEPGKYEAKIPLLLNGELNCPYRYLNIEGVLRGPSLVFSQPAVVFAAVPLNVEVSQDIIVTPVDYPRYCPTLSVPLSIHGITLLLCLCLQCFDAVGWVAGRASGL